MGSGRGLADETVDAVRQEFDLLLLGVDLLLRPLRSGGRNINIQTFFTKAKPFSKLTRIKYTHADLLPSGVRSRKREQSMSGIKEI